MSIEFLIDESKKEIEKLNKLVKQLGIVKKPDEKSKLLKRLVVEAIRAKHHMQHVEKHKLDTIKPVMLKPAKRQIPYFKPHEIHKLTRLPEQKKFLTISEKEYPIIKAGNYVLVRAVVDGDYKIIEPPMTALDIRIINDIKSRGITQDEAILSRLRTLFASLGTQFSNDYLEKIKYYLSRDNRLGKIAFIMRDEHVKTIRCDGLAIPVRVVYNGRELETDITYNNLDELNDVVNSLATIAGIMINENDPVLDATLTNGTRVQGILGNKMITPKFVITK